MKTTRIRQMVREEKTVVECLGCGKPASKMKIVYPLCDPCRKTCVHYGQEGLKDWSGNTCNHDEAVGHFSQSNDSYIFSSKCQRCWVAWDWRNALSIRDMKDYHALHCNDIG